MRILGITEIPSFFVRSYVAYFCMKHDLEVVAAWTRSVRAERGYLLEEPTVEPANGRGICSGIKECNETPVTKYKMYYIARRTVQEYLRNVPQEFKTYEGFLSL